MDNRLEAFLDENENHHAREALLMHRLLYDVQLAAARHEYFLEAYTSEVDHDGFDIILDDRDLLKKIQVKSVLAKARTTTWQIHKSILRPTKEVAAQLGFECSPAGVGVQGGVILMEVKGDDHGLLSVNYYFTDVLILVALDTGMLPRSHRASRKAIRKTVEDLHRGASTDKVNVPKTAFIRAKGADELLSLAGFHNTVSTNGWNYHLLRCLNQDLAGGTTNKELAMPLPQLKAFVLEEMVKLADENFS